jgi:hypothetical protein
LEYIDVKIVVSLTSIPARFSSLGGLMDMFQAQTLPPDAVKLYIPKEYDLRKFGKPNLKTIPDDFDVQVCDQDYGPATKILPAAKQHMGQEIALIYCDDDRNYDQDMIKRLMSIFDGKSRTAAANEVVKVSRALFKERYETRKTFYKTLRALSLGLWDPKNQGKLANFFIAAGMGGVAIKPEWLNEEAFDIPTMFRPVDDVWLSGHLTANNVTIKRSGEQRSGERTVNEQDITLIDPLTTYEHDGMDRASADAACVRYFQKHKNIWT